MSKRIAPSEILNGIGVPTGLLKKSPLTSDAPSSPKTLRKPPSTFPRSFSGNFSATE